jgi:hypothetical protein
LCLKSSGETFYHPPRFPICRKHHESGRPTGRKNRLSLGKSSRQPISYYHNAQPQTPLCKESQEGREVDESQQRPKCPGLPHLSFLTRCKAPAKVREGRWKMPLNDVFRVLIGHYWTSHSLLQTVSTKV